MDLTGEEDRREQDEAFWINVRMRLESGEASVASAHDRQVVNNLAGGQKARGWMSMIPIGLVSSYRYLYDCVKGLGCEDADIIERDVLRTVGAVKDGPGVFGDTSDLGKAGKARAMHRILTAISITDSMGYCQGMNYVADFLLKMVNEEDAFCLFLYALRNKHLCCLYETKLPILSEYMEIYERQLSHRLPELAQHLKEHGFIAPFYSIEWFTTLFVLSCPFELTVALWDLFFMGVKDVQIRCAVALMESIEQSLVLMGTEELLKNFRTVAVYKVDAMDVILRALRLDLAPVKVGAPDLYSPPTPNGTNQENHNYALSSSGKGNGMSSTSASGHSFLIDPRGKFSEDSSTDTAEPGSTPQNSGSNLQGDILLTLRLRYLRKAREAMQERDMSTGMWAQEQLQRGHDLLQSKLNMKNEAEMGRNDIKSESHEGGSESIQKVHITNRSSVENFEIERSDETSINVKIPDYESGCDERPSDISAAEFREGFTVNNYFEFLVDGELMNKAYALKEVVSSCDRVTQWVHLNQKWADCLEFMENKLSQYNMADHMLRYAITINAHIRVISFFLAVAGADPNSQDRWLRTPLHFAAVHNRPDVVRVLLLAGADSSIPGALNKSLLIAPISSPIGGALKSGRMITATVLCQATYGNALSSYPASLSILKGRACILCNTLESSSLASAAKRRHSRILNGRLIPNMQVQASLRTSDASSSPVETSSSGLGSMLGKATISNCPRCNIPMCAACLPDHHCIYDIIQEEFTWKVNLVKNNSNTEPPSDGFSNQGSISGATESNVQSSIKGTKALRQLGKVLFMRRPSLFGKSRRTEEDSDDTRSMDRSCNSLSTASGDLVSTDGSDTDRTRDEQANRKSAIEMLEDDVDDVDDVAAIDREPNADDGSNSENNDVHSTGSDDSGFEIVPHNPDSKNIQVNVSNEENDNNKVTKEGEGSGVLNSPKLIFNSMFRSSSNSSQSNASLALDQSGDGSGMHSSNKSPGKKKKMGISDGLKKMHARMKKKKKPEKLKPEEQPDFEAPRGGMPMYWIGYRDEANRQATLQPWQIILLPLVQGGEYNRVLYRSGNFPAESCKNTTQPTLQEGPDSDDDSFYEEECGGRGEIFFNDRNEQSDTMRVHDDEIHQQVKEIYANSLRYPGKNAGTFTKRKEPKYLYFVSEMEGLYRTLGRDATEIFAIEPLPTPPPMITSVTASYLHVKHRRAASNDQTARISNNNSTSGGKIVNPEVKVETNSPKMSLNDEYDSWDETLVADSRECIESSSSMEDVEIEGSKSVPAFSGITAFNSNDVNKIPLKTREESCNEVRRIDSDEAEAEYQQQLQIKGLNGLKKDALKRFLSGSWTLNEDDDMWVPDEDAWYCRKCSEQFSLFRRKHHCRRCGNVFCDEDAPRVDASECLHESLQQAFVGVIKEEYGGKKKEKIQFRLCMSCKNEIRHSVGLYIELDFLLPRYNFSTWLISLLSKTYNNMCQSAAVVSESPKSSVDGSVRSDNDTEMKNVRLKKFAVAGHWMDSMADWLWRDRQLQLDNT